MTTRTLLAAALTAAIPTLAVAAPVVEFEPNDTRATAQSLSGLFTPDADPNVFGTGVPTASVTGAIGALNDVDFFSFTGVAGSTFYADLDDTPLLFDTYLGLFNGAGTLLAISDDTAAPTDPGSPSRDGTAGASSRASFIGSFTLPETDTYFVSVTDFGNRPVNRSGTGITQVPLTRPDGVTATTLFVNSAIVGAPVGGDALLTSTSTNVAGRTGSYTLHVSVVPVPEPTSLAVLGLGGMAVLARRRRA